VLFPPAVSTVVTVIVAPSLETTAVAVAAVARVVNAAKDIRKAFRKFAVIV